MHSLGTRSNLVTFWNQPRLNLGNSCWHSGTLAAAKQAALLGARGIAFSTHVSDNHEPDFSALEPHVAKVLDLLMQTRPLCLVNVNVLGETKRRSVDGAVCAPLRRQGCS